MKPMKLLISCALILPCLSASISYGANELLAGVYTGFKPILFGFAKSSTVCTVKVEGPYYDTYKVAIPEKEIRASIGQKASRRIEGLMLTSASEKVSVSYGSRISANEGKVEADLYIKNGHLDRVYIRSVFLLFGDSADCGWLVKTKGPAPTA